MTWCSNHVIKKCHWFSLSKPENKKIALAAIEQQKKNQKKVVGLASSSCTTNTFPHQKSDNERDCKQTSTTLSVVTFISFNCCLWLIARLTFLIAHRHNFRSIFIFMNRDSIDSVDMRLSMQLKYLLGNNKKYIERWDNFWFILRTFYVSEHVENDDDDDGEMFT